MTLIRVKPTSPGRRGMVKVINKNLYKGRPFRALIEKKSKNSGRNNYGRITTRHIGGGHKQNYRIIDFKRKKDNVLAKVERIEYDPNRSANIALLCYIDGDRRYILATKNMTIGDYIINGSNAPIKSGNCLPIRNIPIGTVINCIEILPGKGAQIARSAGSGATLVSRESVYSQIRLRSGEVRHIHIECRATIGEIGNIEHNLRKIGKAGAMRWRGIRPTVRGVAMNPVDHPHGGGEGKTSAGRHPVSPWGVQTKGKKTRNNKRTDSMIVSYRKNK
ncbi:50S ribosomal protein L2 [Candidatus Profftella armatura (Diaphorina cf. continua)]|uniref:Large ribosomal subunit protein uL2 n=1 Tax=Candidatus Profftella armatura (Diaphorina cf. continua) TaxID=2661583 RepID=A0A7R6VZG7_9PROT|nr:50S ribosomal protein L2 [Candidatus Profftella armatura (Diaphorina cf. continua)]BCG49451.1 50S ribosomal protein L2 [Candidatus Profftella armatura (Diaphorina cf. continua)]